MHILKMHIQNSQHGNCNSYFLHATYFFTSQTIKMCALLQRLRIGGLGWAQDAWWMEVSCEQWQQGEQNKNITFRKHIETKTPTGSIGSCGERASRQFPPNFPRTYTQTFRCEQMRQISRKSHQKIRAADVLVYIHNILAKECPTGTVFSSCSLLLLCALVSQSSTVSTARSKILYRPTDTRQLKHDKNTKRQGNNNNNKNRQKRVQATLRRQKKNTK